MDSIHRFSELAGDYAKYRPSYPPDLFEFLQRELGINAHWTIADIGSGTGMLTDPLLRLGARVYAVEPNRAMRMTAEGLLGHCANFESIEGTAERTTLRPRSIDLVVAGQSFHWFEPKPTRTEFQRILRPGGVVALVWNDRRTSGDPFLEAYEALLHEAGIDYASVCHRNVSEGRLAALFGPAGYREAVFPNAQHFDWHGLLGRAMSSSYVPREAHPGHAGFVERLRSIYDAHQHAGWVSFHYDTRLYYGALS